MVDKSASSRSDLLLVDSSPDAESPELVVLVTDLLVEEVDDTVVDVVDKLIILRSTSVVATSSVVVKSASSN